MDTALTVHPQELRPGMITGDAERIWYKVLSQPVVGADGNTIQATVLFIDGGTSSREWDWDVRVDIPLIDESDPRVPDWMRSAS